MSTIIEYNTKNTKIRRLGVLTETTEAGYVIDNIFYFKQDVTIFEKKDSTKVILG